MEESVDEVQVIEDVDNPAEDSELDEETESAEISRPSTSTQPVTSSQPSTSSNVSPNSQPSTSSQPAAASGGAKRKTLYDLCKKQPKKLNNQVRTLS